MPRFVWIERKEDCQSFVRSVTGFKQEVQHKYTEAWEVGTVTLYPTDDNGFWNVCELPAKVAITWLNEAGIMVTGHYAETLPSIEEQADLFGNKMAVVVDVSWGRALAIYKHDFHFYLIRKDIFEEKEGSK